MGKYIVKRILQVIPMLFILSLIVFMMVRLIPGDPVDMMLVYMGWWMIVFPAIFTALSVLGFNLFGDGLRDLIDPLSGR